MLQALIIVFREGFESFLTVAIIFAYLKKTGRDWLRPAVWWGIGAAVIASVALGFWLRTVTNQPLWEGILALVAAVLVATFVIHIWRVAPTMKKQMEAKLEAQASRSSTPWAWAGRSEEHTSELQSQSNLVCRLLLEKKKKKVHPQAASQPTYDARRVIRDGLTV